MKPRNEPHRGVVGTLRRTVGIGCLFLLGSRQVWAAEPDLPSPLPEVASPLPMTNDTGASVRSSGSSITNTLKPPADAFVLRRWEMIPPAAPPRVITAQFPITTPMLSVESMAWCDNRLWLAARLRTVPQVPATVAKLWAYNPENNRLEAVPGLIEKKIGHR